MGRIFRRILLLALLAPIASATAEPWRSLEGVVVDAAGAPVEGAVVRLRAGEPSALTDRTGRFRLLTRAIESGAQVTAAKPGYVIAGAPLVAGQAPYRLVLQPIPATDDASYAWVSAYVLGAVPEPIEDTGREPCGTCHRRIEAEWHESRHAKAALNPRFLAFFDGKGDGIGPPGAPFYHRDFPLSNGNCAHCHLPVLALAVPRDADPHQASGVEREGIGCDFCHKIADLRPDPKSGRIGAHAALLRRPGGGRQLVIGPLDDVPRGRDAMSPIYRDSRYCALCHDGGFWGIAAYSEFEEWKASSFAASGVQCQDCHMRNLSGADRLADAGPEIVQRRPETLSSHRFHDSSDPAFLAAAVELGLTTALDGGRLRATVRVANRGAGHDLPAGAPMRHMILVVSAMDADGRLLAETDGERVPEWGGTEEGPIAPLAGLPGKGFAKILKDRSSYFGDRHLDPFTPAPHWRPTYVVADTRIAAGAADESAYGFAVDGSVRWPVTVTARLLIRRTYQSWALAHGLADIETEAARETVTVER